MQMLWRRWWRWGVPAGAAVVVAGTQLVPGAFAGSTPQLPSLTASALIAKVETSNVQALSGTVETTADLGLPALPDRLAGSGASPQALLTGTHDIKVAVDGAERQRLALLGNLAEMDVIHNGPDLWTYNSSTQTYTHRTVPTRSNSSSPATADTGVEQLTPQAEADKALAAVTPSTDVQMSAPTTVAGQPAYVLTLTPKTTDTLIRQVTIAVDANRFVPLRVQVFAGNPQTLAWQSGFTTIDYGTPESSQFDWTPPTNAVQSSTGFLGVGGTGSTTTGARTPDADGSAVKPTTIGAGWAGILELPAGTVDLSGGTASSGDHGTSVSDLIDRVTTAVPEGRLLSTRLFTALITPDGHVYAGAVPGSALQAAAVKAGAAG